VFAGHMLLLQCFLEFPVLFHRYWNTRIAVGVQLSLAAVVLFRDSALRPWKEFQNTAVKRVRVRSK